MDQKLLQRIQDLSRDQAVPAFWVMYADPQTLADTEYCLDQQEAR